MGAHGVARELEETVARARAARRMLFRLKLQKIGDEVGLPHAPGLYALLDILTGLGQLASLTGVAIFKRERIIEDEIEIAKLIARLPRAGEGDEPRRLGGLRVEMLMPGIQRR